MGLLDDAIREHLELKRLGGADPGEVAREEQDALGPVRRDGEPNHDAQEFAPSEGPSDTDRSSFANAESATTTNSPPSQETVEINMEAELSGEGDAEAVQSQSRPVRAAPVAHSSHPQGEGEDSLEWEVPSESSPDATDSGGGEEPKRAHVDEEDEQVEDVLEETPDFLRDTPEQERLWFEQRPPRDFDFNE